MGDPAARRRIAAFTLIEMLVVITITLLLLFLLANVLGRAREHSRTAYCLSNLRQLGVAMQLYATENQDYLPPRGIEGVNSADPVNWPGPPGYPFGKGAV